jgi:phytoene dehydrogenase-like protein
MTIETEVVVIGAGLAGLSAAIHLRDAGIDVQVVEASDAVGGRLRTDHVDGYTLDRGFAVHNPAYPEAQALLDHERLDLRSFEPGVAYRTDAGFAFLAHPRGGWKGLRQSFGTARTHPRTAAAFAAYAVACAAMSHDALMRRPRISGRAALRQAGVDNAGMRALVMPFLQGVLLESQLDTNRRVMDEILATFVKGTPAVPSGGMQSIAEQLASRIPMDALSLNAHVDGLDLGDNSVTVRTAAGEVRARKAIIAVSREALAALLPDVKTGRSRSVTTWYHRATTPGHELLDGRPWVLTDMLRRTPIANSVVLTNAAPSYAPTGETLVSTSIIGIHREIAPDALRKHLSYIYDTDASGWDEIARYEIAHALPDFTASTPEIFTQPRRNVWLAGDYCDSPSINGALRSGRTAADNVSIWLRGS